MRWSKFLGTLSLGALLTGILTLANCSSSSVMPKKLEAPEISQTPVAADAGTGDLSPLFSHIWRIVKAPSQPPPDSIYVFLPNGTLLETSCVETYRIATWTVDKDTPHELRVVEDRQLAFTAKIAELTNASLRMKRRLARGNGIEELMLTAVEGEFVCRDMPK